ncbi:11-subunit complex, subunit H [Candidatus Methanoplasma termitum]|uniref:FpoH2 protein n=1 Tax=Candidatus Methanoplasma termitum TaxID=1577791 RepID=A0A0A7LDJ8_9ARCH|nr:complex I subunit 1 family protein [Candidatus Methanoplasma termitum]AIZ57124.1 11-subunit complex, subunit H [Candidatus Methanoplasma termitum]
MPYSNITDWIHFSNVMDNPFYPFGDIYNLPFDISYKLWQLIGGFISWIINLIFPGNGLSTWLISPEITNIFALLIFMILIFLVAFIVTLLSLWMERKVLGRVMDRRGTMIGLKGFMQCLADGFKTFLKEDTVSRNVDKKMYLWTAALIIGTSALIACMIPLSGRWFVVNYGTGLLIIMALFALAPFFILVSGWAQNNKYSLIGGMRAAELMISYEVPMLIMIATAALMAGSFNIGDIVNAQHGMWFLFPQIIGFITFFYCATAEAERVPFDIAEAEAELVEGWQTEYAGMKWGLIMLADYMRGYVSCAMIVILFLGGWLIPFAPDGWQGIMPEIVMLAKIWLVFLGMIILRGALARVRTDQIVNIGWKIFMPLAVVNLMIVIVLKLGGWF